MENFKLVVDKLKRSSERYDITQQIIAEKQALKLQKEIEYKRLIAQVELDLKTIEVFKKIIETVSMEGLRYVKDLVTRGLQTIFNDDVYVFDIEISDRGANKTVEFFIEDSRGVRTEIANCGGGIQAVVSFIFQVYFIFKLKLPRILFLDEAFARLSQQYAEGLLEFMTALKKEGFKILWITHATQYINAEGIDRVYEIEKGHIKLVK